MKKLKIVKKYDNYFEMINSDNHNIYFKDNNFYLFKRITNYKLEDLFKVIELDYEILLEFKKPINNCYFILKNLKTNKLIVLKEILSMNRLLEECLFTEELKYELMLNSELKEKLKIRLLKGES